jgi:hypothetical protein
VVVELVARLGDRDRAMDGLLDGLTQYLDSIDFPRNKRKQFTGFFWRCRPYLLVSGEWAPRVVSVVQQVSGLHV